MKFIKRRIKGQHVARRGVNLTRNNTCAVSNINTKRGRRERNNMSCSGQKSQTSQWFRRRRRPPPQQQQQQQQQRQQTQVQTQTWTRARTQTRRRIQNLFSFDSVSMVSDTTMISSDSKTIFLRFGKYSVGFRNYILSNSETTASDLDSTAEDSGIMSENYFRIFFWGYQKLLHGSERCSLGFVQCCFSPFVRVACKVTGMMSNSQQHHAHLGRGQW